MTGALEPGLGVPPAAVPAWRALRLALGRVRPPCRSAPERWFDAATAEAVEACHYCPATAACLAYAVAARERSGVWGGVAFPRTTTRKPTARERTAP